MGKTPSALAKTAVARGRKDADRVVARSRARLERRAVKAAGARATAGVLVAEGDSWFDYPMHDVLKALEDDHGFDVESVAHRGDRVEDMAYADGQLDDLARRLEKLLRRRVLPRAILLSGGGNDIAGTEFHLLLNHARSAIAGVNESVARGIIDERIRFAYIHILAAVTRLCDAIAGTRIPILTHGYAYPTPDGRGVLGGWWFLPGPWLEPGFRDKGFHDVGENRRLMRHLIDRFNAVLVEVSAMPGFTHVRYVDLRPTLPAGKGYKKLWANELHPTPRGFALVAGKIAAAIP